MANSKLKGDAAGPTIRYPVHRGPFLFAPHFLTEEQWFPEFYSLIEQVLAQVEVTAEIVHLYEGRHARIIFSKAEMTIDGQGGLFVVDELGSSYKEDGWLGPLGTPDRFLRELEEKQSIDQLGHDYRNIQSVATLLARSMSNRFKKALQSGLAQLTARKGSPFSDPCILETWQLRYLKINDEDREDFLTDDLELDEATGSDDTKLFGLGVAATQLMLGPDTAVSTPRVTRRGPKQTVDHDKVESVMHSLLRQRGRPSPKTPMWTGEIFARVVREKMGSAAPSRATILKKLPLAFEKYRRELSSNGFSQSPISEIQLK
jgi:hypothetical protein